MLLAERLLIWIITRFVEGEALSQFLRSPQTTAVLVGSLIAMAGGLLGTFLLLRGLSLTSDAISHTVLLGIVVAFMVMLAVGAEPRLNSPWLLMGAAAAGVGTVLLTEIIHRSGLVKEDAALGLAFPLLFAVAVIFVSRSVDDVHLDEHAVMVGEIGVAWANTTSHCYGDCETVEITETDARAEFARRCTNCRSDGISPRDAGAQFVEVCTNCGEYTAAQAYQAGLTEEEPTLVFWPQAITVTFVMALLSLLFVTLFYKELKLATFDPALARSLGFRPTLLLYLLMTLVSLVAVGAFDAVGSILVIAFFIIPVATSYLLTDRLPVMLVQSTLLGSASAWIGYDLARGSVFGLDLDRLVPGGWDTSISASIVTTMLFFFGVALLLSPRYGLLSASVRRVRDRLRFEEQVVLGHIYRHRAGARADTELAAESLPDHVRWPDRRVEQVLSRVRSRGFVRLESGVLSLTARGEQRVRAFWRGALARGEASPAEDDLR